MKPDPSLEHYKAVWEPFYEKSNYENGLAALLMRRGHVLLEQAFDQQRHFGEVLEVGAGTGVHLGFVRHSFKTYVMTDGSAKILKMAADRYGESRTGTIEYRTEDARRLSFPDASFDRLIATHVLEHLTDPHEVLREWARVVRPGGIISLLQPSDPGLLWRLGRSLGPRAAAEQAGMPYDYWMAREHVNSIFNIVNLVRYYFDDVDESWYPARIPLADLNLFYLCHIHNR